MSAQVAADLRAAAEVLRRDGWTQGEYVAFQGQCCAVGALMKVVEPMAGSAHEPDDLNFEHRGRLAVAAKALTATIGLSAEPFWDAPVTRWNDADHRTADEVIAALEAAADAAEAQP